VEQKRLSEYKLLRMGQAPEIDVHIIKSDQNPGGSGELSTPVTAPSLCNSIFAATGKRIRKLPLDTLEGFAD
jgi:isoquinoline 1-oxidoreductase subunit beta